MANTNGVVAVIDDDGVIRESREVTIAVFVRSPWNYDRVYASESGGLDCVGNNDPGYTQQQFKDESDINTIVRNFGITGQLPQDLAVPQEGDFSDVGNFHDAMNVVRAAEESFMQMPANVRDRFANDPGKFLEYVNDPDNKDEAMKLGILNPASGEPVVPPSDKPITTPIITGDNKNVASMPSVKPGGGPVPT